MRIAIFTNEFPYPANNGGRVEIWNGIKAFKILGHEIFFVAWAIYDDNQKDTNIAEVNKAVDEMMVYKRKNDVVSRIKNLALKLLYLPIQPNIVTDCQLSKTSEDELYSKLKKFNPDTVLCYSVFAAKTARVFALKLKIPFLIRSHNIEHLYVKKQLSAATSLKGYFKLFGSYASLKKFELGIFAKIDGLLDISNNDAEFWRKLGTKNVHWQPPVFFHGTKDDNAVEQPKQFDIGYVGNLFNPNNITGLFWFLNEVLPLIERVLPDVKICFAGSRPADELLEACKKHPTVTVFANPQDVSIFYDQSKLMINPTLFGSGVNLKTIEQLFDDAPVVCTTVALAGLPGDFNKVFKTADDPADFAELVISALKSNRSLDPQITEVKKELQELFSAQHYSEVLETAYQQSIRA